MPATHVIGNAMRAWGCNVRWVIGRRTSVAVWDALIGGGIAMVCGIAYIITLAPGLTWANGGADSGDLVTAAAVAGVAHPTGYPTYLLLARVFQIIPFGDLAVRTTLLSAVSAALTVLLLYRIVRTVIHESSWTSILASGVATGAFGLSPVFWSQAVIAEVYSLNTLFVVLLLCFIIPALRIPASSDDRLCYQGILAGLALGNHRTILILVAIWLVIMWSSAPPGERLGCAMRSLLWISVGLLVYAYVPLTALARPPVNWGRPLDWHGFWWNVSGQAYRGLVGGIGIAQFGERLAAWASLLTHQFGPVGLTLGILGMLYASPSQRPFVRWSGVIAASYSLFAIGYNAATSYAYLIPTFLIFAVWMGIGLCLLIKRATDIRPTLGRVVAVAAAAALLSSVPATAQRVNASRDRRAIDYATTVLADAPAGALILTETDEATFPLWYYHYALHERQDVAIIVTPLLDFSWYRANLHDTYPNLQLPLQPTKAGDWTATLAQANPARPTICRATTQAVPLLTCTATDGR